MATTLTKEKLSGSTNGKAVKVAATSGGGSGTTIHTAIAGTADWDEVWMYAVNTSSSAVKLTLEYGTTTAADGNIEQTIQGESGLVLVVPGLILQNGLVVTAFAGTANVILIFGYVNRIDNS